MVIVLPVIQDPAVYAESRKVCLAGTTGSFLGRKQSKDIIGTNMKYTLEITDKQAWIVRDALNFYFRSYLGQLDLWHVLPDLDKRNMMETSFQCAMGCRGYSKGRYSKDVPEEARRACDIHDVIRHQLWKDNPNRGTPTVDSTAPCQSSDYDLPEIKIIEETA